MQQPALHLRLSDMGDINKQKATTTGVAAWLEAGGCTQAAPAQPPPALEPAKSPQGSRSVLHTKFSSTQAAEASPSPRCPLLLLSFFFFSCPLSPPTRHRTQSGDSRTHIGQPSFCAAFWVERLILLINEIIAVNRKAILMLSRKLPTEIIQSFC